VNSAWLFPSQEERRRRERKKKKKKMGMLMSFFASGGSSASVDFQIDFTSVEPSPEEQSIWEKVQAVVEQGATILEKLAVYKGCGEQIREAINKPTEENEDAAWQAILPAVDELKEFYDYSADLCTNAFVPLMTELCKDDPKASISGHPAWAKQLAQVFDFVIRFDDMKMVNPAIQNDFSYYRRTLNRMKLKVKGSGADLKIKDELANRMSLFFAYPTPMMNSIIAESGNKFSQEQVNQVTKSLGVMAMLCQAMVKGGDPHDMFLLRCMVGSVILYDHLHPQGAFRRGPDIDIKNCILTVKNYQPEEDVQTLINVLRFTNMHLNDPQTPATIKNLLE